MLNVIYAGPQTTVQDTGRSGLYHLGFPPSGAADRYSFTIGNFLLGNPVHYAGLEMAILGPTLEFEKTTVIAVTGAPCQPHINGSPVPMWENLLIRKGDILSFKTSRQGVRSYLCVSGGVQVPKVLGSHATYMLGKLGGFDGRPLQAGDKLNISEPFPGVLKRIGMRVPDSFIPEFKRDQSIRAVMGLSSYLVSDEGVKTFLETDWVLSAESDRVACRYTGPSIALKDFEPSFGAGDSSFNVVDTYYPIGGIMIPNPQELIVLHLDGTSGGGFVTIGTVISSDLDLLAQLRPMSTARFLAVTTDQALTARQEHKASLLQLAELLEYNAFSVI